jgi:beta-lactamase class A
MRRTSVGRYVGTFCLFAISVAACFACFLVFRHLHRPSVPTGTTQSTNTITTTTTAPTTGTTTQKNEFSFTNTQKNELDALIRSFSGKVSVYYEDLESGYIYENKAETKYFGASLIKAPYCLYVLQLATDGKCDLNETMTYTAEFYRGGTGIIQKQPYGTTYTVKTLVEYAIRYSDNIALRMLRHRFGIDSFKEFAKKLGIQDIDGIGYITNSSITARDAAVYMNAIYDFIETEENGELLKQYMLSTKNKMLTSSYPLIRKYGWADASFHDMAIVDAPHPYILIVCTDHEDGTAADFGMFRKISAKIETLSNQERQ